MKIRFLPGAAAALAVSALALGGCTSSAGTPSAATSVASTVPATPTANANQLTVIYEENCQVELIAPSGQRILMDVWNTGTLSAPPTASDILLTTHTHGDHYVQSFESSFPGKKLTNENGDLTVGDIKIKSLAASHDDNPVDAAQPTNHIFVIDFNGFHIVQMGSTGEDQLTAEQSAAIGTPDIAFSVLIDLGSTPGDGSRPVKLAEALKPRLLIPTHTKLDSVKLVAGKWPGFYAEKNTVKIAKDKLTDKTQVLFMGQLAPSYGAILNFPATTW